jgi:hypothetical protein
MAAHMGWVAVARRSSRRQSASRGNTVVSSTYYSIVRTCRERKRSKAVSLVPLVRILFHIVRIHACRWRIIVTLYSSSLLSSVLMWWSLPEAAFSLPSAILAPLVFLVGN